MSNAAHRIRRQSFRVVTTSQADAFEVRQQLRSGLFDKIKAIFEQAFDDVAPSDDVVVVPQIELRVRIPSAKDTAELPALLGEALKAELSALGARPRGAPPLAREIVPARFVPAAENRRAALITYLETGTASWPIAELGISRDQIVEALKPRSIEEAIEALVRVQKRAVLDRSLITSHARLLSLLDAREWTALAHALAQKAGATSAVVKRPANTATKRQISSMAELAAIVDAAVASLCAGLFGLSGHSTLWFAATMIAALWFANVGDIEEEAQAIWSEMVKPTPRGDPMGETETLPEPIRLFFGVAFTSDQHAGAGAGAGAEAEAEAEAGAEAEAEAGAEAEAEAEAGAETRAAAGAGAETRAAAEAGAETRAAAEAGAETRAEAVAQAVAAAVAETRAEAVAQAAAVAEAAAGAAAVADAVAEAVAAAAAAAAAVAAARATAGAETRAETDAQAAAHPPAQAAAAAQSDTQTNANAVVPPLAIPSPSSRPFASTQSSSPIAAPSASPPENASIPARGAAAPNSLSTNPQNAKNTKNANDAKTPSQHANAALTPSPTRPSPPSALFDSLGLVVAHAGLILLVPFLSKFFENTGVKMEGRPALPTDLLPRAAALLCLLATGEDAAPEFELGFIKVLLGLQPESPLPIGDGLTAKSDQEEADSLLQSTIGHFRALKNTSVSAFRSSFLKRRGILREDKMGYRLQVVPAPYDMILNFLPWGIGLSRLSWMKKPIVTEWPAS